MMAFRLSWAAASSNLGGGGTAAVVAAAAAGTGEGAAGLEPDPADWNPIRRYGMPKETLCL